MSSLYEQIKADLGYLKLDAAAGSFATLAEQARSDGWSHIEYLARLVGEQATAESAFTGPRKVQVALVGPLEEGTPLSLHRRMQLEKGIIVPINGYESGAIFHMLSSVLARQKGVTVAGST